MENTGKADYLIQNAGCGVFQTLMVLLVYGINKIPTAYTMLFMSFGNFNPGWRCLDNVTTTINDTKGETLTGEDNIPMTQKYTKGLCSEFEVCQRVEFDPKTSTIVTEWGLLCDRAWISSLIISVQMGGILIGSLVSGYLGDRFGRKNILYGAVFSCGVLNIVSIFVQSWESFAVVRFFMGLMLASILALYYILPSEFLTNKWRGRIAPIPAWHIGGITFAVTAMVCRDWKIIHLVGGIMCFACCIPALWVPESLRWLEVKNKSKAFTQVAKKMTLLSKNRVSIEECENTILNDQANSNYDKNAKKYNLIDIFRKGYRLYSSVLAFVWVSSSIIYYAISFGVKAMSGNFYINLIILYALEIPLSIFPILLPNIIGRKWTAILFIAISTICLLIATAFEVWVSGVVHDIGTMVLAVLAKTMISGAWYTIITLSSEIYPTIVRSISLHYVSFMARLGGILAPLLIPQNPETVYICYLVMGILGIVCCCLILKLPETKGMKLKETFDDE